MNNYLWLVVAIIVLLLVQAWQFTRRRESAYKAIPRQYTFTRRESVMSSAETQFFHRLEKIVSDKYYVFPQIHLSSLLDNKVANGQSWKGALSTIQRKSVDYVLADKASLQTVYAIELDDYSHDADDRKIRDSQVETLLKAAGITLVRLRNVRDLADSDITDAFIEAKKQASPTSLQD